jgi:hypothetical protein
MAPDACRRHQDRRNQLARETGSVADINSMLAEADSTDQKGTQE